MARTIRGNLTGRAAAVELADQRWWLHEEALRQADAASLKRAAEIIQENDLIRRCVALEDERSFFKWWDDDEQVQAWGLCRERIVLLEKRLKALCNPHFDFHTQSVAKERPPER